MGTNQIYCLFSPPSLNKLEKKVSFVLIENVTTKSQKLKTKRIT